MDPAQDFRSEKNQVLRLFQIEILEVAENVIPFESYLV